MNLDAFIQERKQRWQRLEEEIGRARGRPDRLGAAGIQEMGRLYRQAAADLAVARRSWPRDPETRRLESIVIQGRALVYGVRRSKGSLRRLIFSTYWRQIAHRPLLLLIASLLLFVPAFVAVAWGMERPHEAVSFLPEEYRVVADPERSQEARALSAGERSAFSSTIFTNNIRVTFLAFAAGITLGFGTAYLLIFNGFFLGTVVGLSIGIGRGPVLAELVIPHGILELSCIIVAGAAGIGLGWSLVDPGDRSRGAALVEEGKRSIELILGTIPWLVGAGLIEGFVTPSRIGIPAAVAVGALAAAPFWYFVLRARKADASTTLIA
ncbi:MAG: stage II sporulation protein M [Actinomycetota bacterium]